MPNESFIHADIFFFISTVALVLISAGMITVLIYVIRILKTANDIVEKIKIEGMAIIDDVRGLRLNIRNEALKWKQIADLIKNFFDFERLEAFFHKILERWFGSNKIEKTVKMKTIINKNTAKIKKIKK